MFACAARFAPRFTIEKEETLPMKMLRRSVCLLLCAALFLTLLAGCGKQEEPAVGLCGERRGLRSAGDT